MTKAAGEFIIEDTGDEGDEYPAESLKRAACLVEGLRRNAIGEGQPPSLHGDMAHVLRYRDANEQ